MSSIIGKQFENKSNGDVNKVVSIDGSIAVLENDQRISVERLLDTNHYGEIGIVNESSTNTNIISDNNLHNNLYKQIQNLSNDSINNAGNQSGGATIEQGASFVNPVESHSNAQRKMEGKTVNEIDDTQYNSMIEKAKQDQLELSAKLKRQTEKVSKKIDGIENDVNMPIVNRNLEGATMEGERRETSVKVVEDIGSNLVNNNQQTIQTVVNPMFTKMKRTKKVSLKIDIEEMMPSKDLLKMLEEGFEDSVLDYLTDEIAGKVLTDNLIKSQIKKKLHEYVYGKPRVKKKTTSKSKTTKKK